MSPAQVTASSAAAMVTPTAQPTEPDVIAKLTPIILEQPTSSVPTELAESFLDQKFPAATLNIYRPGSGSRIASPIQVNAYAYPGDQGKVTVQLFGEDGRLMAKQLIRLTVPDSGGVSFSTRIPFEITSAGESALLAITTHDAYGRRISLNSVPLILLQVGDSEIEVEDFQKEPYVVKNLTSGDTISGGTLHIEGYAHPFNQSPLVVELIKQNAAIIVTKIVILPKLADGENFVAFSADIPYVVDQTTEVRVSLRQMMDHSPYLDVALSSLLINLEP